MRAVSLAFIAVPAVLKLSADWIIVKTKFEKNVKKNMTEKGKKVEQYQWLLTFACARQYCTVPVSHASRAMQNTLIVVF